MERYRDDRRRDALKGFLNKLITIRGGVIINEALVGVAR